MTTNPLENHLGYQLRRSGLLTIGVLSESYATLGLNLTEAAFIRCVQVNPGCTQADISRMLGMKRTNLAPVAGDLIARALIERAVADGRSHSLHLTPAGTKLAHKLTKLGLEHEQFFFGDIPDETRQILLRILLELQKKAEQYSS